ncbi:MAG TPA: NfeD family protein [Bacilli bacterium]|nr:NfeD family protein [Bacilli bacterium]
MSIIWSLIIVLLLLLEIMTISVVAIWFAMGASISLIITLMDSPLSTDFAFQFILCIGIGTVLTLLLRKRTFGYLKSKSIITEIDKLVGETGIVTKKITKNNYGQVKVNKKTFTAYSDEKINVSKTIEVLEINGVKLKVKEKV